MVGIQSWRRAWRGIASFAAAWMVAACGYTPETLSGALPAATRLALSPDGRQVLATWKERDGSTRTVLLETAGTSPGRALALPRDVSGVRWSRDAADVLVTTASRSGSELRRIDVGTGRDRLVYRTDGRLAFPIEVNADDYVFLQADDPARRASRWQRFAAGTRTTLADWSYGLAAPLEQVQGSLHLLLPTKVFAQYEGTLPAGMKALVTRTTWLLHCADTMPLTCVRTHVFMPTSGGSYATMEILRGGTVCKVGTRWIDEREVLISRDGSTVVFQGGTERGGPRSVYVVRTDGGCQPVMRFQPPAA